MPDWLKDALAKPFVSLKVLLTAWPTFAATITALLAVVAQDVVPHLSDEWAVKAAAYVAAVAGAVAVISAAVARVTPILYPSEKGILPLPEAPVLEFDKDRLDLPDAEQVEREWKTRYAPGVATSRAHEERYPPDTGP